MSDSTDISLGSHVDQALRLRLPVAIVIGVLGVIAKVHTYAEVFV